MLPLQKVKEIVSRYNSLEKELSSGNIDPKQFASKSKEYANLGNIILIAKEYINFDNEKKRSRANFTRPNIRQRNY